MLHIKSIIPKTIDKIKLKEDLKDEGRGNSEKTNKNTPNYEVFLVKKQKNRFKSDTKTK